MIARFRPRLGRLRGFAGRLRHDKSGLALIEFAFAAPIMLTLGMFGLEAANLALVNMRISQIALNLADTASRVGLDTNTLKQIRESDIDDSFNAVILQGGNFNVTNGGRFILSSLEQNTVSPASNPPGQTIRWQRCIGTGPQNSAYGPEGTGKTNNSFAGMGPAGAQIKAPSSKDAVMYVEAWYVYQPLISSKLFGTPTIHTEASFLVRDMRDLLNDPVTNVATPMTCNLRTATVQ
jgi:hypothetical protein